MRNFIAVLAFGLLAGCASLPADTDETAYTYEPDENVVYYIASDNGLAEFYGRPCPYVDQTGVGKYMHDGVAVAGYGQMQPFCWALLQDTRVAILIPGPAGVEVGYVSQDQLERGPAPVPPAMPEQPKGTEV